MLEPSWVGRRVSVRRVLDHVPHGGGPQADGESRPVLGDVVGDLVGLDARTAVVAGRTGLVEIPVDRIAIARLVPASTADELAVEAAAAEGLRPAEADAIGGWLLRADHGFTHRANSVLPLRQPGMPLDAALTRAHDWYAARGLPLRLQVPVEARRLLDAELGERGWPAALPTHVYVARLDALHLPAVESRPVRLASEPDDDWLSLYRGGGGLSETGRALLARHERVAFATLRLDGRVAAVARGAVDGEWLGVMAVEVDPAHRRGGLATAVMSAISRWGAAQGAGRGYLQVSAENTAAAALYEKLGYWIHHDYHYRTEPS